MPKINHIALWNKCEKNAYKFYQDILGFEFLYDFHSTPIVAGQIFAIKEPMNILVFGNKAVKVEIFVNDKLEYNQHPINHTCFDVEDIQGLLEKIKEFKLPQKVIRRNNHDIVFIKDFDGNLFEIKSIYSVE